MPVTLTVSQVRNALFRGGARTADSAGNASTAALGRWFHEGLCELLRPGPDGPLSLLVDMDHDLSAWKEFLAQWAYEQVVGPRLTQQRAALHNSSAEVCQFWRAMHAACDWLAELCWAVQPRSTRRKALVAPWTFLSSCLQTGQEIVCELRQPGWSDSVRLVGIADALLRLTQTNAWCVVEFKTGQGAPAADLGQACLYHMILTETERASRPAADEGRGPPGALTLISFRPERQELLFSGDELVNAQARLLELIGRLAGVCDAPTASAPVPIATPAFGDSVPAPIAQPAAEPTRLDHDESHLALGNRIVQTLAEYGVDVTLDNEIIAGPTFLRYQVILGRGTKVEQVIRRGAELQVRLQLKAEPFISRQEGRLVIDVQRRPRQTVYFDDIRAQLPPRRPGVACSSLPIGVDLFGKLVCADLSQTAHAHLLVAGTTGSGKSEWLRMAIAGLMLANTPDTLRLVIIDPKRNAFHALRESPFLREPIVFPDEQPAEAVLERLCTEMDDRYRLLDGADTIADVPATSKAAIPRIVCVCDEYRDLISRDAKERKRIEALICRLGAKARAAGIHLILATQEPSRSTVTGALDSNMPARVGLRMNRDIESRMLLGEDGAEKLLGHGDLLFKEVNAPTRLQAPLLTDANRAEIFHQL